MLDINLPELQRDSGHEGLLALQSRPLGQLSIVMEDPAQTLAPPRDAHRRPIRIIGGSLIGPRIRAEVLPGGGDWAMFRGDGVLNLDVRLALRTADGALIFMTYHGYRHASSAVDGRIACGEEVAPSEMYYRIAPVFETGDSRYDWMTRMLCIGIGERLRAGPRYQLHEIL